MSLLTDRLQRWFGAASLWLVCFSISCAPFPFGSVGIGAITLWVGVLSAAALLACSQPIGPSQNRLLLGWALLALCWSIVIAVQMAPPNFLGGVLNDPIWKETSRLLGEDIPGSPSTVKMQPVLALGPSLVVFLGSACGLLLGGSGRRGKAVLRAFAWSGLAYAIYGIIAHIVDPTKILTYTKEQYVGELTATFYNRNTAAIYFGCCGAAWLALMLEHIKRRVGLDLDRVALKVLLRSRQTLFNFAALMVCVVAMFMTRSRAGSVASLIGWGVVGASYFHPVLRSRKGILTVLVGSVVGAAIGVQFLGGGLAERIGVEGVSDEGRWYAYQSTWHIIQSAPWLGKGLGSFPWVFPAYRSPNVSVWGVWDRAHNTLLEIAAEVGVPMAAVIVVAWIVIGALLVGKVLRQKGDVTVSAVALGMLVAASLHTMVDFPLQIPAFALVFFVLLGCGLAAPLTRRGARLSTSKQTPN
ncbi:O-antigen ligase family protein [Bradyrhizobium manausense]|uniref:O-antigen ligase family protein n=1 Tax=Bradyrhizobium manausense TaxID=989370 RepID=UPI001BA47861|nr:O-antigen ligase family protein [Bradyrhizobium manausense]MBR1092299.1 O-antigen ligase family protein [Bradyrhizobium manausense]